MKKDQMTRRRWLASCAVLAAPGAGKRRIYIVPNFHPASCGWLTNFSMERVYCANSYFDHLDRVRADPNYAFVLSECNNMMAMLNFRPEREAELKNGIRSGRVELVNGFFLESTTNLSGGEALVRLGVEGLRWQQQVFGVRPRFAWCIDICGTHPQMAQITAGLGLDAFVYARGNHTGSAIHWLEAPDGTKTLAVSPGHYSDVGDIFAATGPLTAEQTAALQKQLAAKARLAPEGAPMLAFGGYGDYNLAPRRPDSPSAFIREWRSVDPGLDVRFSTLAQYVDEVAPQLKSGAVKIPTMRGGGSYYFHSFWIQNPCVKTAYRRCEHQLQAAEMLAAAASLRKTHPYPSESLYHSWLQMFLNMDRNTLWGAAGGMVFEHETSWDAADRFRSVEGASRRVMGEAGRAMASSGRGASLFNALHWRRRDAVVVAAGQATGGGAAEALPGGRMLWMADLPATSLTSIRQNRVTVAQPKAVELPASIENKYYAARVDPKTGNLESLKLKPSGREMLSGGGNLVVAERPGKQEGDPGDHMLGRAQRLRLGSSADAAVKVTAMRGAVALTVTAKGTLLGTPCRRVMRFYHESPRIDFETTLNDVPDRTVVVAEFPLAEDVREVRRAIPYGFTHGAWPEPSEELPGRNQGITPAVRWSHYGLRGGGGAAILDRGLSGRELTGRTPVIFLLNTTNKYYGYPNSWLSGEGQHVLEYALLAHDGPWAEAGIARAAWEYNSPVYVMETGAATGAPMIEASANVIVESMRRYGKWLEVRMSEVLGQAGRAEITINLPHRGAELTNFVGGDARPVEGGPRYGFAVRPQQIITLRLGVDSEVPEPKPLVDWAPLVPESKRAALRRYSNEKGHPPRGV
ncbi:MAG: hypothetical protein HY821_16495 [Acidobacteria bacterium]|nr:hypothetical protein [Acidobacteriota bacterium]